MLYKEPLQDSANGVKLSAILGAPSWILSKLKVYRFSANEDKSKKYATYRAPDGVSK